MVDRMKDKTPDTIARFAKALEKAGIRPAKGAKSLAALPKREAVPPTLAALWRWSDGVKDGCFFDPDSDELDDDEGLHFLSVKQAAREMKITPGPAKGIPFASDLGGMLLVAVGPKGRVMQWDHETRELTALASSLDAFLARCTKALGKRHAPKATAKDARSPLVNEIEKMFDRALGGSCRDQAIVLVNHKKARGGPDHDDPWVFAQLAKMLTAAGDAAFVRKSAQRAGLESK